MAFARPCILIEPAMLYGNIQYCLVYLRWNEMSACAVK